MTLFQYAIIKNEKLNSKDEVVEKAVLLAEPTWVLAKDQQTAGTLAARAIPEEEIENLDRITVMVRPF